MKKSLNSPLETILESIVILVVWVVFLPIFWAMSEANSENKVLFWLFLFLGLVLIFLQWKFLPIRHIEFDGNFIYVSNYFRKIVIAISEIE
ncbi:MAG TPA: hypothetical protein PLT08_11535, partial [Anaerolineales bacterium]|nr:hypothetical protein [Anaerolineales bacterium]